MRMSGRHPWWICAVAACVLGLGAASAAAPPEASGGPALRVRVFRFLDRSRTIRLPDGRRVPRSLVTVVRYPAAGGPYPLIVFGHGFALTPARYTALLRAWAGAGYRRRGARVPARERGRAGRSERVRSRQPAAGHERRHHEAADPERTGGGCARREDRPVAHRRRRSLGRRRDRARGRVRPPLPRPAHRAAIVLSGAALPGMGSFPQRGPPLLAVQGTADTTNAPATTAAFFALAQRPKFLLWLLGASHLPPYTDQAAAARNRRARHGHVPRPLLEGPFPPRLRRGRGASRCHPAHLPTLKEPSQDFLRSPWIRLQTMIEPRCPPAGRLERVQGRLGELRGRGVGDGGGGRCWA